MQTNLNLVPTQAQREFITAQLGKEPEGLEFITALDAQGQPAAVQVAALVKGKPFPTLYWLTSRRLVKEISHLEAAGVIKEIEDLLLEDQELRAAYRRSHEDYISQRWAAMSPATKQEIERLGYSSVFALRGVGGIENWQQVRCLHTQYAHHLSRGNAIGTWLDTKYQINAYLN